MAPLSLPSAPSTVAPAMTLGFKSPVTLLPAEEDRAVVEEHYEYLNCCADGAGWYIVGIPSPHLAPGLAVLGTQIVDAGLVSCVQ